MELGLTWLNGCTFNTSLLQTLLHYCATPHATTGVSSVSLMRELQLPLDRLRPCLVHTPVHPAQARINIRQGQMKNRFDRRRQARPPAIAAQDWVRIRRPHRNKKLVSFWSESMQVSQQLGPVTFRLVDDTRWHGWPEHSSCDSFFSPAVRPFCSLGFTAKSCAIASCPARGPGAQP